MKYCLPYQINRAQLRFTQGTFVPQVKKSRFQLETANPFAPDGIQAGGPAPVTTFEKLADYFSQHALDTHPAQLGYPMQIPYYYLSLIKSPGDPLWRQAVPDVAEGETAHMVADPLCETEQSPVPGLIHRYPDRAVFLVSNRCALHCRHCMRRRNVGADLQDHSTFYQRVLDYIGRTRNLREVILSGGDPFMLADDVLLDLLAALKKMPHIEMLRIHTRVPCTWPQRISPKLANRLKGAGPLFINIQFNHPAEITPTAAAACALLANAGIPLGCQSVLLKGVNDDPDTMLQLLRGLLSIRVRPYYLHHPDPVAGTGHFRVPLRKGLAILSNLRGRISGLGVPRYMLDLPGGGGKIPLLPQYIQEETGDRLIVRNFEGTLHEYPLD